MFLRPRHKMPSAWSMRSMRSMRGPPITENFEINLQRIERILRFPQLLTP